MAFQVPFRLTVAVEAPATEYEITVAKVEAWDQSGGKSPNEQVLKNRLRGCSVCKQVKRRPADVAFLDLGSVERGLVYRPLDEHMSP